MIFCFFLAFLLAGIILAATKQDGVYSSFSLLTSLIFLRLIILIWQANVHVLIMKCCFSYSGMKSVIFFVCAAICILPGGKVIIICFDADSQKPLAWSPSLFSFPRPTCNN